MPSPATPSPDEYRILVEQSPVLIWRARTDALCDYFNQRWLDFTGRTLDQEFGNGWAEGVHPDDFDRCVAFYLDHFKRRAPFEMEYRLRRHDGAWRWLFDRGAPVFDPASGEFLGYIGSCVDVTERVEAQEALVRAQESQIRTLQGLLPICMMCKRIKDDAGYWEVLEKYLTEHSAADFSHGLCPDCYPKYLAAAMRDGVS
ncbi:MAG TPA: PAS domain S-box protein [Holophaga sp.]|nr:PAS domain S-box protein [Holophaga sp.]